MAQCIENKNLMEYFREEVHAAIEHQGKKTPEVIEFYLVNLLSEYSKSERVCSFGETLALVLARAMESKSELKIPLLKHLGDLSLYISGFFPASLAGKLVDVDYYVQMGETAYGTLSRLMNQRPLLPEMFRHLADRFVESMDILAEVSQQSAIKNDLGLLRLYETWLKTGSERLENLLTQEGIVLNTTTKIQ